MMQKVGLWINTGKPNAREMSEQMVQWFKLRQWTVLDDLKTIKLEKPLFVISLGGDGTLLEAARELAPFGVPVLGVNLGRLGFLCEIEKEEVFSALERVLNNEYTIQERLMLSARLESCAGESCTYTVLNDVVFLRDHNAGLVTLQANLSGEPSVSYPADGLIVATPTGSTAYSLSAGGPIISPDVQTIILTPLAAHSLSARPMIVSHDEKIEIILARGQNCRVTFDGQQSVFLRQGETVTIVKSPLKALLIRLGSRSFPTLVRGKLMDRWHE